MSEICIFIQNTIFSAKIALRSIRFFRFLFFYQQLKVPNILNFLKILSLDLSCFDDLIQNIVNYFIFFYFYPIF